VSKFDKKLKELGLTRETILELEPCTAFSGGEVDFRHYRTRCCGKSVTGRELQGYGHGALTLGDRK